MTATTFREAFAQAVRDRDARRVGRMVDALRFQRGVNYGQCFALARELTGISETEWDELLYEADHLEAQGLTAPEPCEKSETGGGSR